MKTLLVLDSLDCTGVIGYYLHYCYEVNIFFKSEAGGYSVSLSLSGTKLNPTESQGSWEMENWFTHKKKKMESFQCRSTVGDLAAYPRYSVIHIHKHIEVVR